MQKEELNKIISESQSYNITKDIKASMHGKTMHLHYHILYDIINKIDKNEINYAEIGVYCGGSLSLALHNKKVKNAVGIDPLTFDFQADSIKGNIAKYNKFGANVNIIPKFSTDPTAITDLLKYMNCIDVLFIDGDHSSQVCTADFENFVNLVSPGGYIIFDDYHDSVYSPGVKPAVNNIITNIFNAKYPYLFEIIGSLNNVTEEPTSSGIPLNNEFILRRIDNKLNGYTVPMLEKLPDLYDSNIHFAIGIATYDRKSKKTPEYIKRCLESINNQRYKNWTVYLIGDQYTNNDEFTSYANLIDKNKIKVFNKPDPERDHIAPGRLWNIAGASAMNYGLNWARKDGMKYYVHLDDDDFWKPNHLLLLAYMYKYYANCIFSYVKSTYPCNGPKCIPLCGINSISENNWPPKSSSLAHSSASFRCDIIAQNYFTTHIESQIYGPSDAIMWDYVDNFIKNNPTYCSIYIPILTCHHDEEGQC